MHPNRLLIVLLFVAGSLWTTAQSLKYMALLIPDSLTKDADAVIREESTSFKVKDINTATLQEHQVITVLNSDGKQFLDFSETSDKFRMLDDAEIIVYNAMGTKLNSYSKKEMHTSAYGDGLVEDGKVTWFEVTAASYPITVEINYSLRFRGTLFYPEYIIQFPYQSVQQSQYDVEVPASLGLRYHGLNDAPKPQTAQQGEMLKYTWKVAGLPARKLEKGCGSFKNYLPYVRLAPNRFQMEDYAGDMTSWKQFGVWNASLAGTVNTLPEARKAFFINLVKNAATDREKAELIYRYLQQNMRYVSIQLGIGGWKPFAASFVDEKKYGDCKALSNYMQSALAAVGVKSCNTLIYWDQRLSNKVSNALTDDFPISRFNHMMLCIPQPKDSIWLECTSTTRNFGEISSGTQNRKALMITENGGVLVQTPISRPQQNTLSCYTNVELNEDGSGKVIAALHATGDYREEQLYYVSQSTDDEKNKYLINGMEWKQPDALRISSGNKTAPVFTMNANMQYGKIPLLKSGTKMFLPVRLYPLMEEDIPDNAKRTQDYYFYSPHQKTDTTVYHLPTGYSMDYTPADKNISYPFGAYNSRFVWDAASNTLTVIAHLEIAVPMVKAADYQQLSAFCKAVQADVNEKLVVKRL